ncbi:unnamed protein product [Toxocara canis]|uniref:Extensin-like n=1 Tax=Toxocara canis TaxID=6265 RepID=A0A183TYK5_TOXCA|nr:unnamed protein product [Toxocara canis]
MRSDKKRRYTPPSISRAGPPRQWQPHEQPSIVYTNLNTSRATPTEYVPTQSPQVPSPSIAPAAPSPYQQSPHAQPYQQQTFVQPYPQELDVATSTGYRPIQQETVYQQASFCLLWYDLCRC